ncbi:Transposon TX1 uncharacterized 149 kDa protein [Linum perenne]
MNMPNDKAPGPDGFPASFYKKNWTIVGGDVTSVVLYFFYSGKLPGFANLVILALISKKTNASNMKDYRPISCCNLVYKIRSKILANRMSVVLPSIIGNEQSVLLRGG